MRFHEDKPRFLSSGSESLRSTWLYLSLPRHHQCPREGTSWQTHADAEQCEDLSSTGVARWHTRKEDRRSAPASDADSVSKVSEIDTVEQWDDSESCGIPNPPDCRSKRTPSARFSSCSGRTPNGERHAVHMCLQKASYAGYISSGVSQFSYTQLYGRMS